jgi:uncharacterized protein (DUF1810 family)
MSDPIADPWRLSRFVEAQAETYERALAELRDGCKRSHWMWFVLPQIAGLGFSSMSARYAISGRAEARAYLAHPVLGPRLRECADALLALDDGRSATRILGHPDDLKLQSSATLFAQVSLPGSVFHRLLDRYFGGRADDATLTLLQNDDAA